MEESINGLNEQLNALRENRDEKDYKFENNVEETQTNITNSWRYRMKRRKMWWRKNPLFR